MENPSDSLSRLLSLDAMRGFTIAAMIMVNFPGHEDFVFPTLRHTRWNGLTFTDLIAPTFLFIVGVSIALAYSKKRGAPKGGLYRKIIIRSLKIFAVGMFLNMLPDFNFSDLRYTGTLHRIAIVFLVCVPASRRISAFTSLRPAASPGAAGAGTCGRAGTSGAGTCGRTGTSGGST